MAAQNRASLLEGVDWLILKMSKVAFFSYSNLQTQGSHSAAVFEVINKRFFAKYRKINNLELGRNRFFDFDHGHATKAGEVEIYRFLENCSMEFAENNRKKSVFNILPSQAMKIF